MKACVIVIYLGDLPPWMNTYLKTCYSSGLDFKIITDDTSYKSKNNVEFIRTSREELLDRVNSLGFNMQALSNRKLCDVKILYSSLYRDLLSEYDYWGYGDLDVIYGDSTDFINEEVFEDCDIFSCRTFIVGHGTFIKNTDEMRKKIMHIPQLDRLMCERQYQNLDERKIRRFVGKDKTIKSKFLHIMATDNISHKSMFNVTWKDGKLFNNRGGGREVLYAHFMFAKSNPEANWEFKDVNGFDLTFGGFSYK